MPMKDLIKVEILTAQGHYFTAQQKALETRIEKIRVPEEERARLVTDKATRLVRDKLLGFFKVGEIIKEVLDWNESIDSNLREAKKEFLLARYFEVTEKNELATRQLCNFLSSPQGNTLFNKIIRIIDDSPPDLELAHHLSSALQHVVGAILSRFLKLTGMLFHKSNVSPPKH